MRLKSFILTAKMLGYRVVQGDHSLLAHHHEMEFSFYIGKNEVKVYKRTNNIFTLYELLSLDSQNENEIEKKILGYLKYDKN